jgi:hypothetical protein
VSCSRIEITDLYIFYLTRLRTLVELQGACCNFEIKLKSALRRFLLVLLIVSSLTYNSTVKTEATCSSETSSYPNYNYSRTRLFNIINMQRIPGGNFNMYP